MHYTINKTYTRHRHIRVEEKQSEANIEPVNTIKEKANDTIMGVDRTKTQRRYMVKHKQKHMED